MRALTKLDLTLSLWKRYKAVSEKLKDLSNAVENRNLGSGYSFVSLEQVLQVCFVFS